MDDRTYTIQQYNLYVQQQVQAYQQLANQAAQAALQSSTSFAHAQNVKLTALRNFNELLASQRQGQVYKQAILDETQAKSLQNVWALRKSADVNSRLIALQGEAEVGAAQAVQASSGVVSNTGSAKNVQKNISSENLKLQADNYREHASAINKAVDNAVSVALEKSLSQWSFEQQQDFMKRAFVEQL